MTFCEIFPPDDFPLYFYRYPIAPDLHHRGRTTLPLRARSATPGVFWSTVTGLSQEPSRAAHFAAWEARGRRTHTVLDLDYRPMFWADAGRGERAGRTQALEHVTVAVGNREECEVAVGETDPQRRRRRAARARASSSAIVKQGPKGVLAATRDERVEVPPFPVEVVNGLGAGDAFGGALVPRAARAAGTCAASSSSPTSPARSSPRRLECSTAMPTAAEVEERLASGPARCPFATVAEEAR